MKYRVLERNGKFYPQIGIRFLPFWNNIEYDDSYQEVYFHDLASAKAFIEAYKPKIHK